MPGLAATFFALPQNLLLAQERSRGWFETLITGPNGSDLIVFSFLTVVVLIPSLAGIWYKMRVKEWEIALKQTMVDRGMSAEEICSIIAAGNGATARGCRAAGRDQVRRATDSDS